MWADKKEPLVLDEPMCLAGFISPAGEASYAFLAAFFLLTRRQASFDIVQNRCARFGMAPCALELLVNFDLTLRTWRSAVWWTTQPLG